MNDDLTRLIILEGTVLSLLKSPSDFVFTNKK